MRRPNVSLELLILSSDESEIQRLEAELKLLPKWQSTKAHSLKAALELTEKKDFSGILWGSVGQSLENLLKIPDLRSRQRELPVIVVSDAPDTRIYQLTRGMPQVAHLEKTFTQAQLGRICGKIEAGETLFQREYKRYPTNVAAILKRMTDESEIPGTVLNVSRGGAFVRVPRKLFSLGELIELSVNLSEISKLHRVFAEVAWTTPRSVAEPNCELGLKFMTPEAIYNRYLKA